MPRADDSGGRQSASPIRRSLVVQSHRQPDRAALEVENSLNPPLFGTGWVAMIACSLMVASEYKIRRRPVGVSLAGQADVTILFEVAVYVGAAAFLVIQLARRHWHRRPIPVMVAAWGMTITLALSTVYARSPTFAMVRGFQLVVTCLLCHAIARDATRKSLHRFAHVYVLLVSASVVLGVLIPFPQDRLQAGRFNWLYVHPVIAGSYLGIAVVVLVAYLAFRRYSTLHFRPPVYWFLLAVNVGGLLATQTRGAIAGCFAGSMAVMLLRPKRSRLDVIVVVAAVVAIGAIVFGDTVLNFLQRGETTQSLSTLNSRTTLWSEAFEYFTQRPILGHGMTASRELFIQTLGLGGAHNGFINVLTDAGIVGAAWWVGVLVLAFRSLRRLSAAGRFPLDAAVLFGALMFLVVDSQTTEGLGSAANVSSIWLFVIVGWIAMLQSRAPAVASPLGASVIRPARYPPPRGGAT